MYTLPPKRVETHFGCNIVLQFCKVIPWGQAGGGEGEQSVHRVALNHVSQQRANLQRANLSNSENELLSECCTSEIDSRHHHQKLWSQVAGV